MMTSTFPFYTHEKIRSIADSVRKKYSTKTALPVDVEHIAEIGLRLEIRPVKNLKSYLDMEGMLSKDRKVIFIDYESYVDFRYESRMRFTLAHELGHYFLHREFYSKQNFTTMEQWIAIIREIDENDLEWAERHANEFAGRLLVPTDILIQEIESLSEEISAMEMRATEHGLVGHEELLNWKKVAISNKLAPKFRVSAQTVQVRIKKENLEIP